MTWNSGKIGQCPVCGKWKSVYHSGKLRAHGWQRRCKGGGQYAVPYTIERAPITPPVDSQ